MDLNDYQQKALTTDTYFDVKNKTDVTSMAFLAKVLGLVGESGEFAEKIKKIIRNKDGQLSEDDRRELLKELGDVLWYSATLAKYLGADFSEVAQMNIDKLTSRKDRGVIKSTGDNR